MLQDHCILLVEKEGRIWFHIVCLKLYQCERTTWWCSSVLEFFVESILEPTLKYVLKFVMLEFIF